MGEKQLVGAPDVRLGGVKFIFRATDAAEAAGASSTKAIAALRPSEQKGRATAGPRETHAAVDAAARREVGGAGIGQARGGTVARPAGGGVDHRGARPGCARPPTPHGSLVQLEVGQATNTGMIRPGNEDNLFTDPAAGLFVVADGMGGHAAGEVASEMAVKIIADELRTVHSIDADVVSHVTMAMKRANLAIFERTLTEVDKQGMGTTASLLILRDGKYLIGQVGDSRVYLLREGVLTQLTKDHSYVQEQVDAGFLTPEQARYHPYTNVITRCVGASADVEPDTYDGIGEAGRHVSRRERRAHGHGGRPAAADAPASRRRRRSGSSAR